MLRTFRNGVRAAARGDGRRSASDDFAVTERPGGLGAPGRLRVVTYNVQAGYGSSLDRIAHELSALEPDLVALQEVDRFIPRSGAVDQAALIAERLGCSSAFAGAMRIDGGHYGVAVLSRAPIVGAARWPVHAIAAAEPRVILDVRVAAGSTPLRVLATHADFLPWSATAHAGVLGRLAAPDLGRGLLVLGDLNVPPWTPGIRRLARAGLTDVVAPRDEGPTYAASTWLRVDYVLADAPLAARVTDARRIPTDASDHVPVLADFELPGASW